MKVYECINKVAAQMAKDGISKSRQNQQQGFKFRGIDETLNALAPVLSANGLVMLPRIVGRTVTERETRNGGALFSVTVEAEFDFVAVEDGSTHTVRTFGEAMDSGDKATNKAMSIAFKYAAFLAFCIPVEGMGEDADATVHEVKPAPVPEPIGYGDWLKKMQALASAIPSVQAFRDEYAKGLKKYRHYLETNDKGTLDAMVASAKGNEAALHAGAGVQ